MPERSSAGKTFSIRRLAIANPLVARRSPASTTPSANRMATTVVPCVISGRPCWPPAEGDPASCGEVRRRSSVNDGPGSNPGPNTGSGRSFIAERAYTGQISTNAAEQPPEPQPSTQPAHRALVVHGLEHVGGRQMLRFHSCDGIPARAVPRHRLRGVPTPQEPRRHAQTLRRPPPQREGPLPSNIRRSRPLFGSHVRPLEVQLGAHEPFGIVTELSEPPLQLKHRMPRTCHVA